MLRFFHKQNDNEHPPMETVEALYTFLLERPLDPTGLETWTALIALGLFSTYKLLDSLLRSQEFSVVHNSINRWMRVKKAWSVFGMVKTSAQNPISRAQNAELAYRLMLNRNIDPVAAQRLQRNWLFRAFSHRYLMSRLALTREFWRPYMRITPVQRLHAARMAWVKQLPAGRRILDIGGSSPAVPEGALIELGYPHRPEHLVIFDKPPGEQYWGKPNYDQSNLRTFAWGTVEYVHGYAEDILQQAHLQTQKFDLIFMGQVVEHIYTDKLPAVLRWIHAHLSDNGVFCCDTPNRLITKFQTGEAAFIDTDHKKEYTPTELLQLLTDAGFGAVQQQGILNMPKVAQQRSFDVEDYYGGELLCAEPEHAYCFGMLAHKL